MQHIVKTRCYGQNMCVFKGGLIFISSGLKGGIKLLTSGPSRAIYLDHKQTTTNLAVV